MEEKQFIILSKLESKSSRKKNDGKESENINTMAKKKEVLRTNININIDKLFGKNKKNNESTLINATQISYNAILILNHI